MRKISMLSALLLAFCLLAGMAGVGHAAEEDAVLSVLAGREYLVGEEISFQLRLSTLRGQPLYAQPVDVFLDGVYLDTLETDPGGAARFVVDRSLPVGTYEFKAVYAGYQFQVGEGVAVTFEVAPVDIVIQTVPPVPGLAFLFEGEAVQTGTDGIIRLPVALPGSYSLELLPNTDLLSSRNAEFVQWFPQNFARQTTVDVPGILWQQVGFEQQFPAVFEFVDLKGSPVPAERVTAMTLRASSGEVVTLLDFGQVVLPANRILARLSGLDSSTVVHRVHEVIVDGSDVVNEGQQRFIFSPGQPVRIELLLYDVHFSARDLVFGIPFGQNLSLEFPDSTIRSFPLDASEGLELAGLARGDYEVRIETRAGLTFPLPLVVSRDQEVVVPVVSYIDILFGAGLALALIVGLPLWGRRRQIAALILGRETG